MGLLPNSQVKWACRRGMLELDLILDPFFEQYYNELTLDEKLCFQNLLSEEDQDLFAWFMGHAICPDLALKGLIDKILTIQHSK